jgi:peptidoglycan/xylan/chitin deacetylase (PgdA/CDA1 family)
MTVNAKFGMSRLLDGQLRGWVGARPRLRLAVFLGRGVARGRLRDEGRIYILYYHDVPRSHARSFRSVLTELAAIGSFVSWTEALRLLGSQQALPGPRFCVSFDDGYRSWMDVVLPTLSELRITGTFFLTTGWIAAGRSSERLTWSDCRELASAGMTIGSHTQTHPVLSRLDDDSAGREIRESKSELEHHMGQPVLDFCAPYGGPNVAFRVDRDVAIAAEAGYRSFATTQLGFMLPGDSPYAIKRVGADPSWPRIAMQAASHGDFEEQSITRSQSDRGLAA